MSAAAGPSKKTSTSKKSNKAVSPSPSVVSSADSSDIDAVSDVESEVPVAKGRKGGLPRYQPPPGMEPLSVNVSFKESPLEFDALASKPGVELWAIRVPCDLKPSRLSALTIKTGKEKDVRGSLSTKSGAYVLETADGSGAGAEMDGLSLMVPHVAREGKLFRAPINISRRLLLTPVEGTDESASYVAPLKRKREQPAHLLKFRSCTTGLNTDGPAATVVRSDEDEGEMEVDEAEAKEEEETKEETKEPSPKKSKSDKKERRKSKGGDKDASPAKKKKKSKD